MAMIGKYDLNEGNDSSVDILLGPQLGCSLEHPVWAMSYPLH